MISELTAQLKDIIQEHEGWAVLNATFGDALKSAPLQREDVKRFLACHIASVRDVPTSILSVALRLSHACMKYDYFAGHAVAARTLIAAVHEYGLHDPEKGVLKTHFELYRDAVLSWGFTVEEILNHPDIIPEAVEMANFNEACAQNGPLAKALGCHIALEETADKEFSLLWESIGHHWKAYGLKGMDDPALSFYHIHIIQEPIHGAMSQEAMTRYLSYCPTEKPLVIEGVKEYMDAYSTTLKAFDRAFFS